MQLHVWELIIVSDLQFRAFEVYSVHEESNGTSLLNRENSANNIRKAY